MSIVKFNPLRPRSSLPSTESQGRTYTCFYIIYNIIFINCNWVVTRWQWLFYMYTNKKKVTRKFKSGRAT